MQTSVNGIRLIQAFENCLQKVGSDEYRTYHCPANVLTIGWGTTRSDYPGLKEGEVWSKAKCDQVFTDSLGRYEAAVVKLGSLEQCQFDALVSFVYNCGVGALDGAVGKAIREGRMGDVPACLARWNKVNGKPMSGLTRRRKAEGELWQGKVATAFATAQAIAPQSMPQAVSTPVPTVLDAVSHARGQVGTAVAAAALAGGGAALGPQASAGVTVPMKSPHLVLTPGLACLGLSLIAGGAAVAVITLAHKRLAATWA